MKQRVAGIDLLKLLAVFFVVVFHVALWNNVFSKTVMVWLQALGGIGVNLFAIITGFNSFTQEKRFRPLKYMNVWSTTFFYSVLVTLLGKVIVPDQVTYKDMLFSCFPVTMNVWWYFSSFTGIFFLKPVLNIVAERIETRHIVPYFVAFSLYVTIVGLFADPFGLNWGYSVLWLAVMYVVGALIKKYDIPNRINRRKAGLLLTVVAVVLVVGASTTHWLTSAVFGEVYGVEVFIDYTSPMVIAVSVGFLVVFANVRPRDKMQKIANYFAPATLGVYILHAHPVISENLIKGKFLWINDLSSVISLGCLFLSSMAIMMFCLTVESLRRALFTQVIKLIKTRRKNCV